MVFKPETTDGIYESLKDNLTRKIDVLTNFSPTSFNYLWLRNAFSAYLREMELAAVAIQLSGWPDYAGKTLTQEDLNALGIGDVDPEEINKYQKDAHLDELGKIVGVIRNPGDKAEGSVTVTTVSDTTTIPKGTEFGTQPNSSGEYYSFYTVADATPASGETEVSVDVTAGQIGTDYNVGGGASPTTASITYMPSPPTGVESVYNPDPTSGGVDREKNSELRDSIKNAIFENSGGGTKKGIEGFIKTEVEGVNSVSVEEFPSSSPPYVDVVVEGGTTGSVTDAIDNSRPVGINHNLIRPTTFNINVKTTVSGGVIDNESIENNLKAYVEDRPLGGDIIRDKLVQKILNADDDVEKIDSLYLEVSNETHTYEDADGDGTVDAVYNLKKGGYMATDGIISVSGILNGSSHTFVEGTDYEEIDDDADGSVDSIDWSLAGDTPDVGTDFTVTYRISGDLTIDPREKTVPNTITATVN